MTAPVPVPSDLKPGDRLWYSKTGFATVRNRSDSDSPYFDNRIAAEAKGKNWLIYYSNGAEFSHDTPPIIRIERITSAPARAGKAKPDKDAAWLLALLPYPEFVVSRHRTARLRAIARRLNGGKLP